MKYHIVLTTDTAKRIKKESTPGANVPRSDLMLLAEQLNASFIEQKPCLVKPLDKVYAQLAGTPENWAFARSLTSQIDPDDVVFCPGEEIGIPLVAAFSSQPKRPKMVVWFHRITGLRTRITLKLLNIAKFTDLAVVNSRPNQQFLHDYLKLADERVCFLSHSIDSSYYAPKTPATSSNKARRPIIISVGLEQRDYCLLAEATAELDVDVKVAGFSQFSSRKAQAFPKVMPQNMTNKKYPLAEFLQLYQDADVAVICLKENDGAAGMTALLEAMSCKKPVVCVRTRGLAEYLTDEEAVMTVKPGDARGLRSAILHLLNNPEEAKFRADKAYRIIQEVHDLESQVESLAKFIQTLEKPKDRTLLTNSLVG